MTAKSALANQAAVGVNVQRIRVGIARMTLKHWGSLGHALKNMWPEQGSRQKLQRRHFWAAYHERSLTRCHNRPSMTVPSKRCWKTDWAPFSFRGRPQSSEPMSQWGKYSQIPVSSSCISFAQLSNSITVDHLSSLQLDQWTSDPAKLLRVWGWIFGWTVYSVLALAFYKPLRMIQINLNKPLFKTVKLSI